MHVIPTPNIVTLRFSKGDHLSDYKIHLRFEDGVEGELDIQSFVVFDGIFELLKEISEFKKIKFHSDLGTIFCSNDADLDPDVLYFS